MYIYVSNETPNVDVYWDNLQVTQNKGPLLQENGYYPFGLEMAAISSQAASVQSNNYKFNAGTELETAFDLDYYETAFRKYDAAIGRFNGIDAMAEATWHLTPYQFGNNNPVMYNDPTGLLASHAGSSETQQLIGSALGSEYTIDGRGHQMGADGDNSEDAQFAGGSGGGGGNYCEFWGNILNIYGSLPDGKYKILNTPVKNNTVSNSYYEYSNADGSGVFITPNYHGENSFTEGELYHFTGIDHTDIQLNFSSLGGNKSVGQPGFGESLIPVWGSGRAAIDDFQNGRWGWGLVNSALAISDVFLIKSAVTALGKMAVKGSELLVAKGGIKYLYHYTSIEAAESISKEGLKVVRDRLSYLTNNGSLSGLQAQIELAFPANRALPNAILKIDVTGMTPVMIRRVTGNMPGYGAGGGLEYLFNTIIPSSRITIMP